MKTTQTQRKHRVTVWAGGVNGYPVTCTCGWKTYAKNAREGYCKRTEHMKEAETG